MADKKKKAKVGKGLNLRVALTQKSDENINQMMGVLLSERKTRVTREETVNYMFENFFDD